MSPISKKAKAKAAAAVAAAARESSSNLSSEDVKSDSDSFSSMASPSSSNRSSARQYGRVNRIVLDKNSEEYKKRRERNNMAVKKSRNKSKLKTQQTMERVEELKTENERLETKVKILSKELSFLKDLFLAHAGSAHNGQIDLNLYSNSNGAGGSGINNNNNGSQTTTTNPTTNHVVTRQAGKLPKDSK